MIQTIIKIDERGRKTISKKKLRYRKKTKSDRRTKELRKFGKRQFKNITKSDKYQDYALMKGAYVMKASTDLPNVKLNEMETYRNGVTYPYDKRCHPAKTQRL